MEASVLETGAAGCIGSHRVEALLDAGLQVRVRDSFFSGKRSNLPAGHARLEILEGDIRESAMATQHLATLFDDRRVAPRIEGLRALLDV